MNDDFRDETYVMNLLGHLTLAQHGEFRVEDWSEERCREYSHATQNGDKQDAYQYFGHKSAEEVLTARPNQNLRWPARFRSLRDDLDGHFAEDPTVEEPTEVRAGPEHVLRVLDDGNLLSLLQSMVPAGQSPFNLPRLQELAGRWLRGVRSSDPVGLLRCLVPVAPDRIGPEHDLLDWFVHNALSRELRELFPQQRQQDVTGYLRGQVIAPGVARADRAQREGAQFGYGLLVPLLSYAALDVWLRRILAGCVRCAEDDLARCEAIRPGRREVVRLRVLAALDLDANFRGAVDLLLGEGESTRTPVSAGEPAVAIAEDEPPLPCLADWVTATGSVRLRQGPAAHRPDTAAVQVHLVDAGRGYVFSFIPLPWSSPRHLRIIDSGDGAEIARITGLSADQERTAIEYLSAALPGGSDPILDRVLRARLGPPASSRVAVQAMDAPGREVVSARAVNPTGRLLLARTLEILGFQFPPGADDSAIFASEEMAPSLDEGQSLFACPVSSVRELASQLRTADVRSP